jgi:hypothetical protein
VRTLLERRCGIDRNTGQVERLRLLDAEVRACGLDPHSTVPLLAPVLGIEAEAGYEQVAAEGRKLYELIAQAVQTYLLACLGGGAGLVVAEDLHWFDPSTRDVLGALLDAAAGRLLVVITRATVDRRWPNRAGPRTPRRDPQPWSSNSARSEYVHSASRTSEIELHAAAGANCRLIQLDVR